MMRRIISGLVLLGFFGCTGIDEAKPSGKPSVVATTTLIGDIAAQVGGDRIDLKVVMPAGVDPHSFKPSPADVADMKRADLVLYNGLHLEGKMVEMLEGTLKDKSLPVTSGIPQDKLLGWADGQSGAHDPHVWFDASLWAMAATAVADRLAVLDPAGAEHYRTRGKELVARITKLDGDVRSSLASIPKERRVLITSHDAYNYFGRAYDVEVLGVQGISTESEAGLAAVNEAVSFIVSRKIPAVFVESSVSPKTIEAVQRDCQAHGWNIKIGGELYSDALGTPGEHGGKFPVETYEGMMRYNVTTIVNALK